MPGGVPSHRRPRLARCQAPVTGRQQPTPPAARRVPYPCRKLQVAVAEEDYRLAAELRDEIKDLTEALPSRKQVLLSMLDALGQEGAEGKAVALRVIGESKHTCSCAASSVCPLQFVGPLLSVLACCCLSTRSLVSCFPQPPVPSPHPAPTLVQAS